jgi:hypothetical protein
VRAPVLMVPAALAQAVVRARAPVEPVAAMRVLVVAAQVPVAPARMAAPAIRGRPRAAMAPAMVMAAARGERVVVSTDLAFDEARRRLDLRVPPVVRLL